MAIETLEGGRYEVHFDPEGPFEGFQIRASSPDGSGIVHFVHLDLDRDEAIRLARWIDGMVARAGVKGPGSGSGRAT